jgi:excisionase family DNA binding protein
VSTDDHSEPFLTIPEAAKRLGIPDWTLRKAVRRGDIPAFSFATNRRRVRMSAIEQAVRIARQGVHGAMSASPFREPSPASEASNLKAEEAGYTKSLPYHRNWPITH